MSTWNKQTIVRPQWSWWDIEGVSWSLWSNKVEIRHLLKLYYWIQKAHIISWRAVILSLKYNRSLQLDQTSNPWLSKIYCRQWRHKLFQPFNPEILSVILHNVCFTMIVIAWRIWYCHALLLLMLLYQTVTSRMSATLSCDMWHVPVLEGFVFLTTLLLCKGPMKHFSNMDSAFTHLCVWKEERWIT